MILFYNSSREELAQESTSWGLFSSNLPELGFGNDLSGNPQVVVYKSIEDFREGVKSAPAAKHILKIEEDDSLDRDQLSDLCHEGLRSTYVAGDFLELAKKISKTLQEPSKVVEKAGSVQFSFNHEKNKLNLPGMVNDHVIGVSEGVKTTLEAASVYLEKVKKGFSQTAGNKKSFDLLILGETGTGKTNLTQLLAQNLEMGFVAQNMGALSEHLALSTLFGHKKGAFTGADEDRQGIFELNKNSLVFLDEIGNMPEAVQKILLTFLETRTFNRLGEEGNTNKSKEFKGIIAFATNEELDKLVEKGQFRQDLLARMSSNVITTRSLHENRADVPLLAEYFLKKMNEGKPELDKKGFDPKTLEWISQLPLRNNIRELQTLVDNLYYAERGVNIQPETLLKIKSISQYSKVENGIKEEDVLKRLAEEIKIGSSKDNIIPINQTKEVRNETSISSETLKVAEHFMGKKPADNFSNPAGSGVVSTRKVSHEH